MLHILAFVFFNDIFLRVAGKLSDLVLGKFTLVLVFEDTQLGGHLAFLAGEQLVLSLIPIIEAVAMRELLVPVIEAVAVCNLPFIVTPLADSATRMLSQSNEARHGHLNQHSLQILLAGVVLFRRRILQVFFWLLANFILLKLFENRISLLL